jgi:siroheme synthase (precorrin-2 oxidase/ferrochelatase)
LGVLERKIESLLERRLDICAHFKKDRDEIVESELEKMVGQLRDLRK